MRDEDEIVDTLDIPDTTAGKITAKYSTRSPQMDSALAAKVANFTDMQKRYAEHRSKGRKQADAAEKAGSTAAGRAAKSRVGYQFEQIAGMKEYIAYLYEKRMQTSVVDEIEIAEKLRAVASAAMEAGNLVAANRAIELLGNMINAFKSTEPKMARTGPKPAPNSTTNNLESFKEDDDTSQSKEVVAAERLRKISTLMKSLNAYTE